MTGALFAVGTAMVFLLGYVAIRKGMGVLAASALCVAPGSLLVALGRNL